MTDNSMIEDDFKLSPGFFSPY